MNVYVPDGYEQFSCLMGACRHSCCKGWEIDIDDSSLQVYQALEGPLGERIRKSIDTAGENPCFRLQAGDRCPFLREDGLCDMILEGGEGLLCQICADHPRYRNFYSGRVEMGLGLCCEGAGRMLLSRQVPAAWHLFEGEETKEDLTEEERDFLCWRGEMIALIQRRDLPLFQRVNRIIPEEEQDHLWDYLPLLMGLEHMEDAWPDLLSDLQRHPRDWQGAALPEWLEIPLEQLLSYLFYRHLPGALWDGREEARIRYCLLMLQLIGALCARHAAQGEMDFSRLVEFCRLYSGEMEYSDENIGCVLDALE